MRALVFTGPGEVELRDVDRPRPVDGDVLLDVRAAGICGSELHGFRQPGFRKPPLVMGHEFAGTTPEGRRVAVNPLVSCGRCDLCRSGRPQLCRNRELLGVHRPGGFAESVVVPATSLYELPPAMSWQTAAMVEPLANAVHAWHQLDPRGGVHATAPGRVAIVGAGAIGLVCLLVARRHGSTDVTVVDRSAQRLELARRLGATTTEPELAGEFDAVIDAVGSPVTRRAGIDRVRPGGTCVWLGLADPDPGFDGNALVRQEKRVVGSFAYSPDDFATALALAAELNLGWTTPVGLEQSREVFLALAGGAMEPVKAVIVQ